MTIASQVLLWSVLFGGQMEPSLLEARVDPRVELMSTIFRLAGHPEYNQPSSATWAWTAFEYGDTELGWLYSG
ncbi:MAG: hypothetical protein RL885_08550 [Planctomycetota bacterium]